MMSTASASAACAATVTASNTNPAAAHSRHTRIDVSRIGRVRQLSKPASDVLGRAPFPERLALADRGIVAPKSERRAARDAALGDVALDRGELERQHLHRTCQS